MKELFWVDKYRPRKIEDTILPERLQKEFLAYQERGEMTNLLLTGTSGIGKTTIARILAEVLDYDLLFINGSDEGKALGTIRTIVTQFASSVSLQGKRKVILFDEFDNSGDNVQKALLSSMEHFSKNCSFIFTCNFPNRILTAIHSRTSVIDFTLEKQDKGPMLVKTLKRFEDILTNEGVSYDKKSLAKFIEKFFPDFRRALNELQRCSIDGVVDENSLTGSTGSYDIESLINILKEGQFKKMITWVETTPSLDISVIGRSLYRKMYNFVQDDSLPEIVDIIGEYSYRNAFVADKEINIASMLSEMIARVEFKDE